MKTFTLPDLGEGLAEAEIIRWHVSVGDAVTTDQPMLAVETAKAVVEVPAPYSGVIRRLLGKPGDVIPTGAPLVEFDTSNAAAPANDGRAFVADAPTSMPAARHPADAGTVVGHMPSSDQELIETAQPGGQPDSHHGTDRGDATSGTAIGLRAAPAARALARKLGVDLAQVGGSGRGGVIVVDDVIAHSGATSSTAGGHTALGAEGERLRGMRRTMAQSMALSRDSVASCTIFDDADLHLWSEGQDVTVRLLRAIAAGCRAESALNAWFDGSTQSRRLMPHVDVGIAVDTQDGLIVPVIRDVAGRTASQLRQELDRLKRAARDRTVTPEDLRDVSFMLSNFGMIAGRYATPVVVPPMVAILGSGRLTRDVVAVNTGFEAHLRMPLSLTFDHRCVTGGEAARFMAAVLRDLEKDN
jgi:pyruvate dehydrogenase E2 component (dihydrolipoamide acetyltransferase)